MNSGFYIAMWAIANLFLVGVYDIVAYWFLPPSKSVSYWLQRWSEIWPLLPFAAGLVCGHLLWPIQRSNGGGFGK